MSDHLPIPNEVTEDRVGLSEVDPNDGHSWTDWQRTSPLVSFIEIPHWSPDDRNL